VTLQRPHWSLLAEMQLFADRSLQSTRRLPHDLISKYAHPLVARNSTKWQPSTEQPAQHDMAAAPKQHDVELGHIRDGYPALAAWIGRDPDNETFVFRKFDRLSARNLLHLQCQLIQPEDEIDKLDDEARKSSDLDARQASRRWETLKELAKNPARPEEARLAKADELAVKIREYRECHRPANVSS